MIANCYKQTVESAHVQAEKEGTVESLVPWTVVGRSSAVPVSSAAPNKKNHLIKAAPFGCLDQMLRAIV